MLLEGMVVLQRLHVAIQDAWGASRECKRAQGSPSVQLAANLSVRISAVVQITTSANRWVKGKKQRRILSIHLLHGNKNLQQSEQVYRSMNLLKP
jgi:hypothetical protein